MLSILLLPRTILILSAVIPALILLIKVYRADRLEKEDPVFILLLAACGIFSTLIAQVLEGIGSYVLSLFFTRATVLYKALLYYVVVALSEEGSKYLLLRRKTRYSPLFNCQYDAVVFAVAVSLGFALWENIIYVLRYGFSTAVTRALTAVPGHCSFGVFMGIWYGREKRYDIEGRMVLMHTCRIFSVLIPVLLHGTYDFLCSVDTEKSALLFLAFIALLFLASFFSVRRTSRDDRYL